MSLLISEVEWHESVRRTDEWHARLVLPNGWLELKFAPFAYHTHPFLEGQRHYEHRDGRRVVMTVGAHDGRWWLHVSVSRPRYIPSYEDLAEVKRIFVTDDVQAVQVFPRRERHVNIMPFCLHLWACLEPDGDGLPDFGREGTI